MAEVKVLIEGYLREEAGIEYVSSTTTLIRENDVNVIVDPGMNKELLLKALEKEGLTVKDINFVILTHYHVDHSALTGMFENAQIMDDDTIYSFDGTQKEHDGKVPGTEIEIISTPGHDPFHCSVLAKTKDGNVVVAGDVIWWGDTENQKLDVKSLLDRKDPYEKDHEKLIESRKKILELADWIIPGHGKMFKVK